MKEFRNQHYVPQTYLRGFTNNDVDLRNESKLWKLDKENKSIEHKGIGHICNEEYYYSYRDETNKYNHEVEKMFSGFEKDFNKIKFTANCIRNTYLNQNEISWFTRFEINYIIKFIIFQIFRVPKIMDQFINKMENGFIEMNNNDNITQDSQELKNDIKRIGLPIMFDLANPNYQMVQETILNKNLYMTIIPYESKKSYIINDNPILISNAEEANAIINSKTEITMAITKNIALSFFEYGTNKSCRIISDNHIDRINKSFFKNSTKCCFSGDKDILSNLLE